MAFHSGFQKDIFDFDVAPGWFEARAELYREVAKWVERKPDDIFFDFSAPDAGWMDIGVYSNGKLLHTFPLSAAFNPFFGMREWMESIVNDNKLSEAISIEAEGRTIILHYEHIRLAERGASRMFVNEDRELDKWQQFDATTHPDIGLFYLYDSDCEDIPVVCLCKTKQFLSALYEGLIYYASLSNHAHLIGKEWYYMDRDDDCNPTENNLTLYNIVKSPLVEWSIYSDCAYRHLRPKFNPKPKIKDVIHMWAEYGFGLFWVKGGCCGNLEKIWRYSIELPAELGIKEWYDEFDNLNPEEGWSSPSEYKDWLDRGWEIAKKIRQLLPESVDLLFEWRSYQFEDENSCVEIPHIVPDERNVVKGRNTNYKLKLLHSSAKEE